MRNWRINSIFLFIILFGAIIIGRLIYLQIIKHDFYTALAQGQKDALHIQSGQRGEIFFNKGQPLASNVKSKTVFINPKEISDKEETAIRLSEILEIDEQLILGIMKKDSVSERIKNNITEDQEKSLKEAMLKGVVVEESVVRRYPQEKIASQVIGFFGGEGLGQYGIEGFYEDILRPKEYAQNKYGANINSASNNGADIYLTLDYNIQYKAEELLEEAKKNLDFKKGLIIVSDPNSGKILAMANFPNFDPNKYSEVESFDVFQNQAVQILYEPGSIFKPITMASAIDKNKVTPETKYIDYGIIKFGKSTVQNYGKNIWGEKTMTQVLENSINTGAVFAQKQLGGELFLEYIRRFGFFEKTRIDLYGEIYSENKEVKSGRDINFATSSFGQGIEATPMQMIKAFSAICNGGKLIKPYIVDKIVKDGKITIISPEISESHVISQETSFKIAKMLVSVVENGSAHRAKISRYNIAGKTGTSEIPYSALGINKKGYSDQTWQGFIGYAPAFSPKFLILVKLDSPKAKTSELSAAPIFGQLAEYIINYMQIPPDNE